MSKENTTSRPAFTAPLYAALRQGSKEFAQVLPAFPDSVRTVEEAGTLGNPTPQMVTEQMGTLHGYDRMLDAYASRGREVSESEKDLER
jgi:uncharacterized protein YgbK (DUF1537 family)